MIVKKICKKLYNVSINLLHHIKNQIMIIELDKYYKEILYNILKGLGKQKINLTKKEKSIIKNIYNKKYNYHFDYTIFALYKSLNGYFSSEFISCSLYLIFISIINRKEYSKVLADKGFYNFYLKEIRRAEDILRRINYSYYDSQNKITNIDNFISKVLIEKPEIIIKPSYDTYGGHDIRILRDYDKDSLINLLNNYKSDFVVQKLLKQSDILAKFNSMSLNTFRFTMLNINSQISILNIFLRFGDENSEVDNVSSGGSIIGVNHDGKLSNYSLNNKGKIEYERNGIIFSEYKIPNMKEICDFAINCTEQLPFVGICGLDIALDVDNNPVLIEINLKLPGILYPQIFSGPIFGDRYQEVINYIQKSFY